MNDNRNSHSKKAQASSGIAKEFSISSKLEQIPGSEADRVKHPKLLKGWQQLIKGPAVLIGLLSAALALAFIINTTLFQPYQVFGESMAPTLHEGDRLIISKLGKTLSTIRDENYVPDRGEIIVFKSPINPKQDLIKRVVALPGERVKVANGAITVYNQDNPSGFNPDQLIDVDFAEPTAGQAEVLLGPTEIFVSGDNRNPNGSLDSRNELGPVPIENIVGHLVFRLFPISQAEFY